MILAELAAGLAAIGVAQAVAGAVLAARFAASVPIQDVARRDAQPITDPQAPARRRAAAGASAGQRLRTGLSRNSRSCSACRMPPIRRWRSSPGCGARFPRCDIAVVVDPTRHGANAKVGNLINMLPHAEARRAGDRRFGPARAAGLPGPPRRGAGRAAAPAWSPPSTPGCRRRSRLAQRLGATQITHSFLPGALLARAMGRQDCLGATMVLRRAHAGPHRRLPGAGASIWRTTRCWAGASRRSAWRCGWRRRCRRPPCRRPACATCAPRTALGAHHPRPGAGPVRRLGAAISAVLGAAGGRAVGRAPSGPSGCS